MAIIALFSASHAHGEDITDRVAEATGWPRIDQELLNAAQAQFGQKPETYLRAMEGPAFLFNKFTRKRELALAELKQVMAKTLRDNQVLHGFAAHLIPRDITHVLRVCILAEAEHRAKELADEKGMTFDDALALIREKDQRHAQWTKRLFDTRPWDQTLYDLKIPLNEMTLDEAVKLIVESAGKEALQASDASRQAITDFSTAAKCEMALVKAGYFHEVSCRNGAVTVIVNEYVMRLEKRERDIASVLRKIQGVKYVAVKTGPNYRPTSIIADVDFDMPEKVLLVDDEEDFIMTLSERLEMRDMEPAVAHSGEEALTLLDEEEPDVMVLDLKMPGIDGIEVLRRVKVDHPEVKVIVLTGHGSEKDRQLCMDLGAFAYLEKPVDINTLSEAMKSAKEAIAEQKKK